MNSTITNAPDRLEDPSRAREDVALPVNVSAPLTGRKVLTTGVIPARSRQLLHESDVTATSLSYAAQLREVEDEGLSLAVEALARCAHDADAAEHWLRTAWRSQPDELERAIRAEAIAHIQAIASVDRARRVAT
jgi:hypothetical protein